MSSRRSELCNCQCPLKGTGMCVQNLLCGQALSESRLTLGVMCGLKHLYRLQGLPPCIVGEEIDMSGKRREEAELATA